MPPRTPPAAPTSRDLLRPENNSLGYEFLLKAVENKMIDFGAIVARQDVAQRLVNGLKARFGPMVVDNALFPGVAAILANSSILRNSLNFVGLGLSPQQEATAKEMIDEVLESWRSYAREHGGTLPENEAKRMLADSTRKWDAAVQQGFPYQQSYNLLSSDEQIRLIRMLNQLDEKGRQRFEELKAKAIDGPKDLRTILRLAPDEIVPFMEQKIERKGATAQAAPKGAVERIVDSITNFILNAIKKIGEPITPAEQRHIDEHQQKIADFRADVQRRKNDLKWR